MSAYTPEQQAEHRRELVEALRSGRYKQARFNLRVDDEYCCLGVACELSGLGEWGRPFLGYRPYSYDTGDSLADGGPAENQLPWTVQKFYGFAGPEGGDFNLEGNDRHKTLAALNDAGWSFDKIADVIEAEPDGMLI